MTKKQTNEPKRKFSHSSIDRAINRTMAAARDRNILFNNLPVIPPVESWIGHQPKGQVSPPAERRYLIDDDPAYPKGLYVLKETNSAKSRILAKHLQSKIVKRAHEEILHQGSSKTPKVVPESYYWPKIPLEVSKFCNFCTKCKVAQVVD